MKKSFLALAALGAAGAACAQSSLTMFGVVDATLAYGNGSLANRTQLTRGGLTTPRFGVRGVEDLGGGLSASFWLEAGLNNDDGTGSASNVNNQASGTSAASAGTQGLTFGRRSTVSMAGNWGEVRLGRDYVPQYWSLVLGDPFGNVGAGASVPFTQLITGVTGVRASNSIAYFSPANLLGGLALNYMHYEGENASNAANAHDGRGDGLRVAYGQGPFNVSAAYGRTSYVAGDVRQANVHGDWTWGALKLMGQYSRDENGALKARGGSIGGIYTLGANDLRLAYSRYRTSATLEPTAQKLAAGVVHYLSKRTALYVTVAHVKNSGGAAVGLNGAITAPNASSTGYDLGLRHAF